MPLLAGHVWHHHYGKIAAGWAALMVVPFAIVFGPTRAADEVWHIVLQEYIPFIALLLALYVTGGGVLLKGSIVGTPMTLPRPSARKPAGNISASDAERSFCITTIGP